VNHVEVRWPLGTTVELAGWGFFFGLIWGLLLTVTVCACANLTGLPPILRLQRLTGNPASIHSPSKAALSKPATVRRVTPFAIAVGPDGNVWFSELRASAIGRVTPAGEIFSFDLGRGALAERLTAGPDGAIWFTDPAGNRIGRLGLDGTIAYVPLPTPDSGPAGIISASDGNLWITEHAANRVGRVTPLGTLTEFLLPHGGGPAGIAEGRDRRLYIAENAGNRIDRISMTGRVEEFPLPTAGARPDGVIAASDGEIWFTEFAAEKVGHLTIPGQIYEYALAVEGPPVGITASDTYVWVTVPAAHALCRVARDGSQRVYVLGDDLMPGMIAWNRDGNLWFTQPNGMLGRFSPLGIVEQFPAAVATKAAPKPEHLLIGSP
jgi:virginiamycin B lyase